MQSPSEKSYGARIGRAKTIHSTLETVPEYSPMDDDITTAAYGELVAKADQLLTDFAFREQEHSSAGTLRQKLFKDDPDSLYKMARRIARQVRSSKFGKKSREYEIIQNLANKIRGVVPKRIPKKKLTEEDPAFISQSESGFDSMIRLFEDMITKLDRFGDKYNATGALSVPSLRDKLTTLLNANKNEATLYALEKKTRDDRTLIFKKLSTDTQRVKDAVLAQFHEDSSIYKLIKNISV